MKTSENGILNNLLWW